MKKIFFFFVLTFVSKVSFGSTQTVLNSLSGNLNAPITKNAVLQTNDQWFNYVIAHPTTYTNNLIYANEKARVILRYDDSKKLIYNQKFTVQVTYDITYYDKNNSSTTATSQFVSIDFDPREGINYKDIDVKEYTGAVSANIKITCVQFGICPASSMFSCSMLGCAFANTLPSSLSDVYLDLEISNEKYYNLDPTAPPLTVFPAGFTPGTSPLVENQLTVNWNYVGGAESYDLEWLFIDMPDQAASGSPINISSTSLVVPCDWKNATRVNVTSTSYNIPMIYSSGILLFRVRAVGYELQTVSSVPKAIARTTEWSSFQNDSYANINSTAPNPPNPPSGTPPSNYAFRYDYHGLNTGMNWVYTASYAEEGIRQEGISYVDGVSKSRQEISLNYEDDNAVISETKYDYQGRKAVHMVPTPVASQGLAYYSNFANGFTKANFDVTAKVNDPDPLSSTDVPNVFYNTQSVSTGQDDHIASAQGYAYARTTYKNDGTDRPYKVSGVGLDHRLSSTLNHDTRYYYGTVNSQTEIDRMFGNEVGYASHYHKTLVRDPNGQVSVTYHDQEDRTIATCISGNNPTNLVPVDNRPAPILVTDDVLAGGKDQIDQDGNLSLNTDILVTSAGVYSFAYQLNPSSFCLDCGPPPIDPPGTGDNSTERNSRYCPECKYDITIYLLNDDDNVVQQVNVTSSDQPCIATGTSYNMTCTNFTSLTLNFTANLDIGKYKLVKILSSPPGQLEQLKNDFINNQNLTHSCIHIPPIKAPDCAVDCSTRCSKSYIYTAGDGSISYIDDNGFPTTQAIANNLIAKCQLLCDNIGRGAEGSTEMAQCSTQCEKAYTVYQSDGVTVDYYLDANGNATSTYPAALIAACQSYCGHAIMPGPSLCEKRREMLEQDMSPGGQYFDNIYKQYMYSSGSLVLNPNYYAVGDACYNNSSCTTPNDMDAWLVAHISSTNLTTLLSNINAYSTTHPPVVSFVATGSDQDKWDELRLKWLPWMADFLLPYHPEYPLYYSLCNGEFCLRGSTISSINNYGYLLNTTSSFNQAVTSGYMDPLHAAASTTSAAGNITGSTPGGNTAYIGSAYVPSSMPSSGDPIITLDTCGIANCANYQNYSQYFNYYLTHFYQIPCSSCSSAPFLSIWYVLDDPYNIHNSVKTGTNQYTVYDAAGSTIVATGVTIDDATVTYFQLLHGNNPTLTGYTPGIFSGTNGPMAKWQFFLGYYNNLRGMLLYYTREAGLHLADAGNGYTATHNSTDQDHYLIRIPDNPLYAGGTLCNPPITPAVPSSGTGGTASSCTQLVDQIIAANSACLGSNATVASQLMNYICNNFGTGPTAGCNPNITTSCTQTSYTTDPGSPSDHLYCFNDVLVHFGCSINNSLSLNGPGAQTNGNGQTVPVINLTDCGCNNLKNLASNIIGQYNSTHSGSPINMTSYSNDPLNPSLYTAYSQLLTDIAAQVNSVNGGSIVYQPQDIQDYITFCDNTANYTGDPGIPASTVNGNVFPQSLQCMPVQPGYSSGSCTCQNFYAFMNSFGYNPADFDLSTLTSSDTRIQIITSDLNDAFQLGGINPPVLDVSVVSWLNECANTSTGHPSISNLGGMPDIMKCPDMDQSNPQQTTAEAQCLQQSLATQFQQAANDYFNEVADEADIYTAGYAISCLDPAILDAASNPKQTFTMTYYNDLFLYTLYYFDQADNLIKTIPPEGFNPITSSLDLAAVVAHRANGSNPAKYPQHGLTTNYKFNTLENTLTKRSPDGGTTDFWYDALGRAIASQNDKQKTTSGGSALNAPYNTSAFTNPSYTYLKYDDLGRVIAIGEAQNSTPLTIDIAMDRDPSVSCSTWVANLTNYRQTTQTSYDDPVTSSNASVVQYGNWQNNLRNRVSYTTYTESGLSGYDKASYYSYNLHGDVVSFVSDNNALGYGSPYHHGLKKTDYEFDIVSGKMRAVHYQAGEPDQMHHQYYYDKDDRLHDVLTSADNRIWSREAKYFYYPHGPLSRTEIGDKQVAGQDHAYTIQGWLKSINNNYLDPTYDIGWDANTQTANYKNLDKYFASDAMGITLGYFTNDYVARYSDPNKPLDIAESFGPNSLTSAIASNSNLGGNNADLFNGNIRSTSTALYTNDQTNLSSPAQMTTLTRLFVYDQLNRLKFGNDFDVPNPVLIMPAEVYSVTTANNNNYYEGLTYDFNGNITTLERWGMNSGGSRQKMDQFIYNYNTGPLLQNNKLRLVWDMSALTSNFNDDIDDQSGYTGDNYQYDDLGNLAKNQQEGIDNIEWTVYGKIAKITRVSGSTKPDLEYQYDATGQRVVKIEKPSAYLAQPNRWNYTYYQRDANGQVMAVYTQTYSTSNSTTVYCLNEQHVYGSTRLGIYSANMDYANIPASTTFNRVLGQKQYELTNHLGNVMASVSDKKLPVPSNTFYAEEYFETNSNSSASAAYEGNYGALLYNPYPNANAPLYGGPTSMTQPFATMPIELGDDISASVYSKTSGSAANNNNLWFIFSIYDYTGNMVAWVGTHLPLSSSWGLHTKTYHFSSGTFTSYPCGGTSSNHGPPYSVNVSVWNAEPSHHENLYLDNLTFSITHNGSLQNFNHYLADVTNATDYYAFGSPMPQRNFVSSNKYRYGMNGQEKDDEIDGNSGNTMGAEYWEYDGRIGRRFNIDPIDYAWQSPYATFDDSPIALSDPEGLEATSGGPGKPKHPWTGGKQGHKKGKKGDPKAKEKDSPGKKGGGGKGENAGKVSKAMDKLADKAKEVSKNLKISTPNMPTAGTYNTNQPGTGSTPGTAREWLDEWDRESEAKEWQDKSAWGVGKGDKCPYLWGYDFYKTEGDYKRVFDNAAIHGNLLPNWTMDASYLPGQSGGPPESIRGAKEGKEIFEAAKTIAEILMKAKEVYDQAKPVIKKVTETNVNRKIIKVTYIRNNGNTPISICGNGWTGQIFNPGDIIWSEITFTDAAGNVHVKTVPWKRRK